MRDRPGHADEIARLEARHVRAYCGDTSDNLVTRYAWEQRAGSDWMHAAARPRMFLSGAGMTTVRLIRVSLILEKTITSAERLDKARTSGPPWRSITMDFTVAMIRSLVMPTGAG